MDRSPEPHMFGEPHAFIDLSDCALPYWRLGQGPDIVFVHGWPLDGRTWRGPVDKLKDRFCCHVIDLPRAGLSHWSNETRIGVSAYGDIVYEAVQRMTFTTDKIGFVGQDTGGSYLRLAAARMPERVSGIVLGNTETPYQHSPHLRLLFALGKLWPLETLLRLTLRLGVGRSALLMMSSQHRDHLHGAFTDLFLKPLIKDPRAMAGAADTLRCVRVRDFDQLQAAHAKITAPVKLVWGGDDWWFRSKAAKRMLSEFGGSAAYVDVRPGRLMIHEEQPQRFADEITAHFQSSEGMAQARATVRSA